MTDFGNHASMAELIGRPTCFRPSSEHFISTRAGKRVMHAHACTQRHQFPTLPCRGGFTPPSSLVARPFLAVLLGFLLRANPPPRSASPPTSIATPASAPPPLHPISAPASYAAPSSPTPASPLPLSQSIASHPQINPTPRSTPIPSAQSSAPPARSTETPSCTDEIHNQSAASQYPSCSRHSASESRR